MNESIKKVTIKNKETATLNTTTSNFPRIQTSKKKSMAKPTLDFTF